MNLKIETDRLALRDYTLADLSDFSAMYSDPEFQQFYSEEDCKLEKWKNLIELFANETKENPRNSFNLVISSKAGDSFIGSVGIRVGANKQASVGCSLSQKFQHSGIALEAMSAIVKFGFEELKLHRIYAATISENKAAISLCKKLKMRKEAELVEHRHFRDRWWNTVVFGLLESEHQYKFVTK